MGLEDSTHPTGQDTTERRNVATSASRRGARGPCGLLNLNKPSGVTSRDIVDLVAKPFRRAKVGHAGTLDPLASGVLVVCVGAATRLIEYVQRMPKTYRAVIRLGARSDTLDADGTIVPAADPQVPSTAQVDAALATQVGTVEQVPPQFSALKVGGRRAYDLARTGQNVTLAARPVVIERIERRAYEWPRLELEISCGSGTYIRSIARDVGETLGCGGLVEVLERTAIGPFTLADALDPRNLPAEALLSALRPAADAVAALPRMVLTDEQVADIMQGRPAPLDNRSLADGEVALMDPGGELVAVAELDRAAGRVRPRRVLASC